MIFKGKYQEEDLIPKQQQQVFFFLLASSSKWENTHRLSPITSSAFAASHKF